MKPDSTNSLLFSIIKGEFYAPDFIKKEFDKYKKGCLVKSGISERDFKKRANEVFKKILFIDKKEYIGFIKKVLNEIEDGDDAPYITLACSLKMLIWSNDKELKNQKFVKVLSTEDLIELVL